jgi:hypothetical protein
LNKKRKAGSYGAAPAGPSRNSSKNQDVCARCHSVGDASGMDCTTWSSGESGAASRSVIALTFRSSAVSVEGARVVVTSILRRTAGASRRSDGREPLTLGTWGSMRLYALLTIR